MWSDVTGGRVTVLRYHNVYGPGMPRNTPYAGIAAVFRSQLLAGGPPRVFEDGRQRRDFVHVRDVAAATVAALVPPIGTDPGDRDCGSTTSDRGRSAPSAISRRRSRPASAGRRRS